MKCLDEMMLLEYLAMYSEIESDEGPMRLSESIMENLEGIDDHLVQCQFCSEKVAALRSLKEDFNFFWDNWNIQNEMILTENIQFLRAARGLAKDNPKLKSKIISALKTLQKGFDLRIHFLSSEAMRAVTAGILKINEQYKFRLCPVYSGVGSPELMILDKKLKEAGGLISENIEQAEEKLAQAAGSQLRESGACQAQLVLNSKVVFDTTVDINGGRIIVKYWPQHTDKKATFALIDVPGKDLGPMLVEFQEVEGHEYLLAEFFTTIDGLFSVILI